MDPAEARERRVLKSERDELLRRIGSAANGLTLDQQRDLNRKLKAMVEAPPSSEYR